MTSAVVVCTYNGRRFVETQLRSIVEQKRPLDRIYLVDDGSTDGTVELVRSQFGDLPQLEVVVNPINLGYVKNFELGIARTKEDVVFLCDQDDFWYPQKSAVMLGLFETQPRLAMAFSDLDLVDEAGTPLGSLLWDEIRRRLREPTLPFDADHLAGVIIRENVMTGASVAVRGDWARSTLPFPRHLPHDHYLAIAALGQGLPVAAHPEPLGAYRRHPGQTLGLGPRDGAPRTTLERQAERVSHRLEAYRAVEAAGVVVEVVKRDLRQLLAELSEEDRHLQARIAIRSGRPGLLPGEILRGGYSLLTEGKTLVSDLLRSFQGIR